MIIFHIEWWSDAYSQFIGLMSQSIAKKKFINVGNYYPILTRMHACKHYSTVECHFYHYIFIRGNISDFSFIRFFYCTKILMSIIIFCLHCAQFFFLHRLNSFFLPKKEERKMNQRKLRNWMMFLEKSYNRKKRIKKNERKVALLLLIHRMLVKI